MTLIKAKLWEKAMKCLKGKSSRRHKKYRELSFRQWLSFGGEEVLILCPR